MTQDPNTQPPTADPVAPAVPVAPANPVAQSPPPAGDSAAVGALHEKMKNVVTRDELQQFGDRLKADIVGGVNEAISKVNTQPVPVNPAPAPPADGATPGVAPGVPDKPKSPGMFDRAANRVNPR